jgi:hypothetical protein
MSSKSARWLLLGSVLLAPSLVVATEAGLSSFDPGTKRIRGKVSYKQGSIPAGFIVFCPEGRSVDDFALAPIAEDGSFSVRVIPGRSKIFIHPATRTDSSAASEPSRQDGPATPGDPASSSAGRLPARFTDPRTSGLSVVVGGAVCRIEIELKD